MSLLSQASRLISDTRFGDCKVPTTCNLKHYREWWRNCTWSANLLMLLSFSTRGCLNRDRLYAQRCLLWVERDYILWMYRLRPWIAAIVSSTMEGTDPSLKGQHLNLLVRRSAMAQRASFAARSRSLVLTRRQYSWLQLF